MAPVFGTTTSQLWRNTTPGEPSTPSIENAFSKLKSILRKAAARNIPELWDAIRDALPRFTAEECSNYFSAAGYEPE